MRRHGRWDGPPGPVLICVLDGVGLGSGDSYDAVAVATTPHLDELRHRPLACRLYAHGHWVGLPSDDDMGNSEVGHNALGAGQVVEQGALLVQRALAQGTIFASPLWRQAMERAKQGGAVHFLGLLSDGNVHSHRDHLYALLRRAAADGARRLFVHPLLDGRDVEDRSAHRYVEDLEGVLASLRSPEQRAEIASGGGRMVVTMDRYEASWAVVERGWNAHVHGRAERFESAAAAIEALRERSPGISDQNLPAFVVERAGQPVGPIRSGDIVININFRGDRALEISRVFDADHWEIFDRGSVPDVLYAGIMQYDGDLGIPRHYLVTPPVIENTMAERLVLEKFPQLAISETQKFGHVTYFWNGNRSGAFDPQLEQYIEVPSRTEPFEQIPEMSARAITDHLIEALHRRPPRLARVNYANGDMVGHTGDLAATVRAVTAVDRELGRLRAEIAKLGGVLIVTADHGNADDMAMRDRAGCPMRDATGQVVAKTSHTLNPVPFAIEIGQWPRAPLLRLEPGRVAAAGIANITATALEILGFVPPEEMKPSLLVSP